jgi:hypothetical protein
VVCTIISAFTKRQLERIDKQRLELLERLTTSVHQVVDGLFINELRCTFECDSILLGALLKQIRPLGLWPRPSKPYAKLSFVGIARAVRSFRSPHSEAHLHLEAEEEEEEEDLWRRTSFSKSMKKRGKRSPDFEPNRGYECSLRRLLEPSIDHLEHGVSGLDLEDIPSSGLFSGHREELELRGF